MRVLLPLLLSACVTRESFPADLAAALCAVADRCGTTNWGTGDDFDRAACEADQVEAIGDHYTGDAWGESLAVDCLEYLADVECADVSSPESPCASLYE